MKPKQARIYKRQRIYRGRLFQVWRDQVVEPGRARAGRRRPPLVMREVVEHHGSVVVLPILPDGRVLLVRQYRYAVGEFLWELVAGHIEPGESPLRAARRELQEETGYHAGQLERLLSFYPTPGFLTEKMHLFRATRLRAGRARPEFDETLETRAFALAELRRMLRRGQLQDGKTLVGLLCSPTRGRR